MMMNPQTIISLKDANFITTIIESPDQCDRHHRNQHIALVDYIRHSSEYYFF